MATLSLTPPCPTVHCIYRIVNFRDGKVYVGQTKYESDRYDQHFNALKKEKHHSRKLQNAYKKYGDGAFFFEVIERDISPDLIDERESYWIEYYDSFRKGYNMNPGGMARGGNYKSIMWGGIEYESIQAVSEVSGLSVGELAIGLKRKGYLQQCQFTKSIAKRKKIIAFDDKPLPSREQLTEMAINLGLLKAA